MIALTLDDWQKIVQICFWIVSGTVVVLTYLRARKSVLSTVNSEYQKRVMDRLQRLSEQLYEEFELDSDEHWSKKDPIRTGIEDINETFENNREEVLAAGEWIFGTPYSPDVRRLDLNQA